MIPWNVLVADFDGDPAAADACRHRLREAWAGPAPIVIIPLAGEDLDEQDPAAADAVVVLATRAAGAEVAGHLDRLQEACVPVLALVAADRAASSPLAFAGALVYPVGTDPARLGAALHGLLHRQREIRSLHGEIALVRRFHGGLSGEIERMHEELQLAAIVQREFLPRELPALYGVRFAALWRPAHYVSGDIYDVSRLDDDHVGIFIADAVGHGVPAALMTMVICRSLTRKIISGASYRLVDPADVLGRLNLEMIRHRGRTTRFATGAYAVVDCRRRVLRLAGAGHPPPILLRADGTSRELLTPGGLLGVFEDETYGEIELELAQDDRLLLYSDGFEQAFPPDQADAYQRRLPTTRYREEFARLAGEATPEEMVARIRRRLDGAPGSLHQVDDLTLICMHAGLLEPEDRTAQVAAPLRRSQ